MRQHAGLRLLGEPAADRFDLFAFALQLPNRRRRAVENGDGIAALLAVAIHIRHFRPEQPIRLHADLVGGAIVDAQRAGSAANIHAKGFPGERLLEDALAEVAGEKQAFGRSAPERGEESQVRDGDVLRLVNDREVEWRILALGDRGRQRREQTRRG